MLLPVLLSACAGGEQGSISYTDDRGVSEQPFPTNYRAELLAFLKTYLNNPKGVHDAMMAEPLQRIVGGRLRYASCLRYDARGLDGNYDGMRERAVLYVDGRLDRIIENAGEVCSGVVYAAFPEMEKMTR